jgi:hypothetical protein
VARRGQCRVRLSETRFIGEHGAAELGEGVAQPNGGVALMGTQRDAAEPLRHLGVAQPELRDQCANAPGIDLDQRDAHMSSGARVVARTR